MSWVITGTQKEPAGDPFFFSNVSLLLHGDGANGSTVIRDSSSLMNTVTPVGNAQISTAQSKFGGASILFDGTGDRLTLSTNESFTLSGDFTIEFWIRINNMQVSGILSNGASIFFSTAVALILNQSAQLNKISLWNYLSSTNAAIVATNTLITNQWYHVAFVRSSSTVTPYLDGVSSSSASDANTYSFSSTLLRIGAYWGGDFNGYIDDLRITKGVARYTANFTPPTAPFPDI